MGVVFKCSSLQEISNLANSLEREREQGGTPLPISINQLPREILLRISKLVKIPHELGMAIDKDDNQEQVSNDFKTFSKALLQVSIPLSRLVNTSISHSLLSISDQATLFMSFSKFLQPEFDTLFSNNLLKELSSSKSLSLSLSLCVCVYVCLSTHSLTHSLTRSLL